MGFSTRHRFPEPDFWPGIAFGWPGSRPLNHNSSTIHWEALPVLGPESSAERDITATSRIRTVR
jgi:hypothetical protein